MQDASIQESMGPIQDRTKENLVSTDNAIIMARLRLRKAAEAVATAAKADAVAAKEREKKTEESWAAKVRDLLKTSAPASVVETSLDGTFDGWSKGTIFQFANGQRWQVTDGNYVTPPERGPKKVRIVPTSFGGYFLEIEGAKVRAKARLIGGQN